LQKCVSITEIKFLYPQLELYGMGLLFGSDDEGCTAHHFDEYKEKWHRAQIWFSSIRIGEETVYIHEIHVPRVARCEHEGCSATDHKHPDKMYCIPKEQTFASKTELKREYMKDSDSQDGDSEGEN